jgi:hypothetical protein
MGGDFSVSAWNAVDLLKSEVYSFYSYDDYYLDFGDNKSEVIDIKDYIDDKGCDKVKSVSEAKKITPIFKGFFTDYEKVFYEENENNTLICSFDLVPDEGGNKHGYGQVAGTNKTFLGFNDQLTKVYFSVKSTNWQSNYSYNFETKKITKENPSNMLKLTLIKDF